MVLMIRKTVAETCARAVTAGALFVCGTLITAFPAYATTGVATGGLTGSRDAQVSSVEYDNMQTPGRTLEVKKPLRVQNKVWYDASEKQVPSVPDVLFEYRVAYDRFSEDDEAVKKITALNAAKDDYAETGFEAAYTPVAMGKDVEKTLFEIWRGPYGGIELSVADGTTATQAENRGTVVFGPADQFDQGSTDTVTKALTIKIKDNIFKRPGVYRYPIEEALMREVDFKEAAANEKNVTGNDAQGVRIDGVTPDIVNAEKTLRYLDIYVEWNSHEDGFEIQDVVFHDIGVELNYDDLNEQDQKFSAGTSEDVSDDQNMASKKEGFPEALYTTHDLIIGKEIMGKGLMREDIETREYVFKVTFKAPAGTKIRRAVPARESNPGPTYFVVGEDGTTLTIADDSKYVHETEKKGSTSTAMEIRLKANQYAMISGLPDGVTYTVEEALNKEEAMLFQTYHIHDMENMVMGATGVPAGSLLINQGDARGNRTAELMKKQALYEGGDVEASGLVKERKTKELTIVAQELVDPNAERTSWAVQTNNVFFLNLRPDNVVTGVAMSVAPYALMVIAAGVGIGVYAAAKKRNRDDDDEMDET